MIWRAGWIGVFLLGLAGCSGVGNNVNLLRCGPGNQCQGGYQCEDDSFCHLIVGQPEDMLSSSDLLAGDISVHDQATDALEPDLRSDLQSDSRISHTVTVSVGGDGGGIVTGGGTISCRRTGGVCMAGFTEGTMVQLTAGSDADSTFAGWSGDCAGRGPCTLTVSADKRVTATFNKIRHRLAVAFVGMGTGRVRDQSGAIDCIGGGSGCAADFVVGSTVRLSAAAAETSEFTGWSGIDSCPGTGPCTIIMDGPKTVTGTFRRRVQLTVSRNGFEPAGT